MAAGLTWCRRTRCVAVHSSLQREDYDWLHIPFLGSRLFILCLMRISPPGPEPAGPGSVYFGLTRSRGPAYCSCRPQHQHLLFWFPSGPAHAASTINPSSRSKWLSLWRTETLKRNLRDGVEWGGCRGGGVVGMRSGYSSRPCPLAGNGWSPQYTALCISIKANGMKQNPITEEQTGGLSAA